MIFVPDGLRYPVTARITTDADNFGIIRSKLELNCTVENMVLLHNLNISWRTPNFDMAQQVVMF